MAIVWYHSRRDREAVRKKAIEEFRKDVQKANPIEALKSLLENCGIPLAKNEEKMLQPWEKFFEPTIQKEKRLIRKKTKEKRRLIRL